MVVSGGISTVHNSAFIGSIPEEDAASAAALSL